MSGTRSGGKSAAKTNKRLFGEDFYRIIGREGGRKGRTGGFYYLKATGQTEKLSEYGREGGRISRRHRRIRIEADDGD